MSGRLEVVQTGQFYCSGCGRSLRHTHDGAPVCQTQGCPFKGETWLGDRRPAPARGDG